MVSTLLDIPIVRGPGERRLYAAAALVAILIVFAGFAPTYYLKGAFGTPDLSTLKHVHGVVMTAWFALFFTQALLVANGRTATHRKLGVAAWTAGDKARVVGYASFAFMEGGHRVRQ
jgi:hypothetical protein